MLKFRESCKHCKGLGYLERDLSLEDAVISSDVIRLGDIEAKGKTLKGNTLAFLAAVGLTETTETREAIKALEQLPKGYNRDLLIGILEAKEPVSKNRGESFFRDSEVDKSQRTLTGE